MEKFNAILLLMLFASMPIASLGANSNLFREYIGAEFTGVKFADVPVDDKVQVHMILAFAIDYTTAGTPSSTDGKFNIFWDSGNLSPQAVQAFKSKHNNVKVALSLGGDSVRSTNAYFSPSSVSSWVNNAVSSLTSLIRQYHLDGIDIDYEHFRSDPNTFTECIGQLITTLKKNNVISFASIAPFDDDQVQSHYTALWNKYGKVIDYVNFQFYAYDSSTTVSQFLGHYNDQTSRYKGGKVLVSFITEGSGGLSPAKGFFDACNTLKKEGKLEGIFVWCADASASGGFKYEKQSQALLEGS